MRRVAPILLAVACLALGCGSDDDEQPAAAPALADLSVTVDRDGKGGKPAQTTTVRCATAAESPRCEKVAALKLSDLEPASGATACTELYGGPETATITGTLRGERVDERFSLEDGCQIARWEQNRDLLGRPQGRP